MFNFGTAANYGSATERVPGAPAVAIATAANARGYWIAFANAQAYALSPASSAPKCSRDHDARLGSAAADLFDRLNDERRARGSPPLAWNPTLATTRRPGARRWAPSDLHHSDIGSLLGPYDYVGENIATGSAGVPAGALHVAWMHSQDHRDNILSPGYQDVGIGVYCAPERLDLGDDRVRPAERASGPPPPYTRQHAARLRSPGPTPTHLTC